MIPVVTPTEMAAIDAAAAEPVEELIDRAARVVARVAVTMLGGVYGRRVVVVVGPGNNGADGRLAAHHLDRRGVRCRVIDAVGGETLPGADLVIDAAFGTGLARSYSFPAVPDDVPVLAVDIPSGVDGLTGARLGDPVGADVTVTFAALKPGLLIEPGRSLAGEVIVADIGLSTDGARTHAVESADVAGWLPVRAAEEHKWCSAVRIVAGSPAMTGAAHLAARAAQRAGAGYVQLATPGLEGDPAAPTESVGHPLPATGWAAAAVSGLERIRAMLVGPGLGRNDPDSVVGVLTADVPLVLDGDALTGDVAARLVDRDAPTVVTPHDGEWTRIGGDDDPDRIEATRRFAERNDVIALRKGPATIIAGPDGRARVVGAGDARLATAGTGDVLGGIVVALIAQGLDPLDAATAGAHVHATAGTLKPTGLVASDLPDLLPEAEARILDAMR